MMLRKLSPLFGQDGQRKGIKGTLPYGFQPKQRWSLPTIQHTMFSLTRIVIILIALSCTALEGAQAHPFATQAGLDRRSSLVYRSQTFEPSLVRRDQSPARVRITIFPL